MTRESVPNTALSGAELKQLLRDDTDRLLDNFGELATNTAFGRCSYTIEVRLVLANIWHSDAVIRGESRAAARDQIELRPELTALEPPPSPASAPLPADTTVAAESLTRDITSPNLERLRMGLPIPVLQKQPDGTVTTEHITYPKDNDLVTSIGAGQVRITDISEETRVAWKIADYIEEDAAVTADLEKALDGTGPARPV
jgi:hypothetical protein